MKKIILVFAVLLLIVVSNSCSPVRAYQRAYLNDAEMELSARALDYFCTNFQSYREGASGANGGKVGGGCGCN
ncbi:MAG: DUF4266 domain-containing protein [Cytophagia bacterium]|nr:DUF4266 domain-containing protein [Cytophagia bacterium]